MMRSKLAVLAALIALQLPSPADSLAVSTQRNLDAAVPALVATLTPTTGLWPDVTYDDPADRSEWLAAEHLRRCLILGVSSSPANAVSAFAGDARVLNATRACTLGWIVLDPPQSNWWWQQFGTLHAVAKLLLLAPSPPALEAACAVVFPRLSLANVTGFAGANRVWGAFIYALVGAARGDAARVDAAAPLLHDAMYPGSGDGIQADASFHQHGPLAYMSYGYGAHFAGTALTMEAAARGTRWAMNASAWGGLARYILDGARWTVRGSEFAIGLMGRHNTYFGEVDGAGVARGHYHTFAAYTAYVLAFPPLAASPGTGGGGGGADPSAPFSSALAAHYARLLPAFASAPRGDELVRFAAQVAAGDGSASAVAGHAVFPLSDAAAHVRAAGGARGLGFALVLHLFSNRTLNSECVNGEGLQNRPLADGFLTAQVSGREYRDVAPAWRWSLVPGTTELQTPEPYDCADAQIVSAAERRGFVGGAGDGWLGAAALDFKRIDAGAALTARKSWAFLDEGAVALGAAIVSDGRFNATTALEQRALGGAVWVGVGGSPPALVPPESVLELSAGTVDWVWHDGTVLVPALGGGGGGGGVLVVSTRTQHGAWSSVVSPGAPNATVAVPMFLVYLHHGAVTPAAPGGYAYAVLPDAAATPAAAAAAASAFRAAAVVVEASVSRHALCRTAPNATLAWLHAAIDWPPPQAAPAGGGGGGGGGACAAVSVSAPAITLVALSRDMATLTVTAASPLAGVGAGGGAAAAPLVVTVAGVSLAGAPTPVCMLHAGGGGVDVVLPAPPSLGASVSAACAVQSARKA